MDTLALLCNLHADGPATLQRLRREGCDSLAALLATETDTLAARMDWDDRGAERFLREALLLAERLDEEEVWAPVSTRPEEGTAEESPTEEVAATAEDHLEEQELEEEDFEEDFEVEYEEEDEPEEVLAEAVPRAEDAEEPAESLMDDEVDDGEEAEEEAEEEEEPQAGPDPETLEPVLGRWRELDRDEPLEEIRPFSPESGQANVPAGATLLSQARLDALTPARVARLEALGVRTLEELAEAPSLELSRKLPMAYTRLLRLQFVARRTQSEGVSDTPAEGSTPVGEDPVESTDGPAGPFA